MLGSADQCRPCDAGKYCDGTGKTTVSGDCDPGQKSHLSLDQNVSEIIFDVLTSGFYCLVNVTTPTPSGYYNNTSGDCLCPGDVGGVCPVGYYCPAGTGEPKPCDGGYYCPNPGMMQKLLMCVQFPKNSQPTILVAIVQQQST